MIMQQIKLNAWRTVEVLNLLTVSFDRQTPHGDTYQDRFVLAPKCISGTTWHRSVVKKGMVLNYFSANYGLMILIMF